MRDNASPSVWAVVVAAGRGTRFGKPYNKVFYKLNGRSILTQCLEALDSCGLFDGAVLVLSEEDEGDYAALTAREGASALVKAIAHGGATRQESVYNGLKLVPDEAEIVAIHDAARPFVTGGIVSAALESALLFGSGIPGAPVTDTIKVIDGAGDVVETPKRDRLCAVQTPQVFKKELILSAHEAARRDGFTATDDAALYEKYIKRAHVIMTDDCQDNIKVTTPQDVRAWRVPYRTGTGYDAHRLVEGRRLVLCGVDIPFDRGLLGHSDADVAVHALIDALLGAAAMGDIGTHFPDSDERYRGISSMALLDATVSKLAARGYTPVNADITIVAQRPKLKDYIGRMRENVAARLGVDVDRVSVKATTTEGMGFEGEGLGISAQAAALIVSGD